MKCLGLFALILVLGLTQAYGQQEVDPDHFDAPATKAAPQKMGHKQSSEAQRHHRRHQQTLAKKHGAGKLHAHSSHASA